MNQHIQKEIEERSIIIKEFEKKFVRGTPPYDIPGGHGVQEAEAWVEADIEELEDWIWGQIDLAEKRGEEKARKEYNTKKYSYQQTYRKRQTEAGNCRTCGKKAVTRGKCERHRKMDHLNGKNYRQRKKALKQSQKEGGENYG